MRTRCSRLSVASLEVFVCDRRHSKTRARLLYLLLMIQKILTFIDKIEYDYLSNIDNLLSTTLDTFKSWVGIIFVHEFSCRVWQRNVLVEYPEKTEKKYFFSWRLIQWCRGTKFQLFSLSRIALNTYSLILKHSKRYVWTSKSSPLNI